MKLSLLDGRVDLWGGDCLQILAGLPPDSLDSCCVDPPYHFGSIIKRWSNSHSDADRANNMKTGAYGRHSKGFMGSTWDGGDIAFRPETWAAVLRVLKPGAHLIAFGAPKNEHRLVCAIEDAGFEIRDKLMWVFGVGFPKNHDAEKAMGKASDVDLFREALETATDKWSGWGTALKPAYEPICLARKPLAGTVQENLREWGTGALNIDACRVHAEDATGGAYTVKRRKPGAEMERTGGNYRPEDSDVLFHGETKPGRWPANLLHDGSPEVVDAFPAQAGAIAPVHKRSGDKFRNTYGALKGSIDEGGSTFRGDSGSAARFFYCSKATNQGRIGWCTICDARFVLSDRGAHKHDQNGYAHIKSHPTVKPVDLLRYLVRLITPPGGTVLDPFAGTGTTAEAAWHEGFRTVLIERETTYQNDIRRRMELLAQDVAIPRTTESA